MNTPSDKDAMQSRILRKDELTKASGSPGLPRLLEPAGDNSFEALQTMVRAKREEIEERLRTIGGVLFRGWRVETPERFEELLEAFAYRLETEYLMGVTPRTNVGHYVFTSTEAPAGYPIFAHNEMSYLNTRPMRIAFYCQEPPERYGETPIFDTRAALRGLNSVVKDRLAAHKVRYVRKLPKERSFWQTVIHRTWPETFLTEDRDEIQQIADENRIDIRWEGDELITEVLVDPIVTHPETGEKSLNLQLYHEANMLLDIKNLAARQSWVTNYITQLKAKVGFRTGRFPVEIRYGDGSRIPDEDIQAIRQATWDTAVLFAWQKGDVLLLENLITAHGRMNVEPPRKIVAAFGRMISFRPPEASN